MDRIEVFKKFMKPAFDSGRLTEKSLEKLIDLGFFKMPASRSHHGAYEGGLFDHSFEVANQLLRITQTLCLNWKKEDSPYIVGMFHDLCKCDNYCSNVDLLKEGHLTLIPGHGEKSVILCQRIVELTDEEIYCIRWHMGAFDEKENWQYFSNSMNIYPNVLYTHMADMIASNIKGI